MGRLAEARTEWQQAEEVAQQQRRLWRDVLLPGAVAGGVGALAMAALLLPVAAATGHGALWPLRLVGGVFFREGVPAGALPVVLGVVLHLGVACGLATLFAFLLPRGGTAVAALGWAAAYALLLQAVMPPMVLPWADPPLHRAQVAHFLLAGHVAFGACLALVPALRRRTARVEKVVLAVRAARGE